MSKRPLFLLALCALMTLPTTYAYADSKKDHDKARQALESGEILPLRGILEKLEPLYPGQILEVELEQNHTNWIYEFKILQDNGKMIKLKVDARDASVLKSK